MRTRNLWLLHLVSMLELLVMTLLVAGCPRAPVNPPPDATDAAAFDAGPSPVDPGCSAWCDHAKALGCSAAQDTPGGASCAEVCTNTTNGPVPFDTACRARAKSCDEADACELTNSSIGQSAAAPSCSSWCAHAKALGCPAAKPTPAGATCAEVCSNANAGPVKWNLRCRLAAKSCAAADACEKQGK